MDGKSQIKEPAWSISALDPLSLPLNGRTLIEASAGTGKTYTLSLLYLRLILGIGQIPKAKPLSVSDILVVTFTNAATEELRYKIRDSIHQFRIGCMRGYHSDPTYQSLLDSIDDLSMACNLLALAEQQMDDAAIYTIHGFCQRMLMIHALESDMFFELDISDQMQKVYEQCIKDIWRRYFYSLPKRIAKELKEHWSTPGALLNAIAFHLKHLDKEAYETTKHLTTDHIIECYTLQKRNIDRLKKEWNVARNEIEARILQSGVNKRSYNSKNLPRWLASVDQWAQNPTENLVFPAALTHFSLRSLLAKSPSNPPEHSLFEAIDAQLHNTTSFVEHLFPLILSEFARTLFAEKARRAAIESDDLLGSLNNALMRSHKTGLAAKLAARYPVALIDEFQDTDKIQYAIFDRIYEEREQTGLVFIGDPKQSIYQFRGADIFVYIRAKESVERIFTMDTNWRSCGQLVHGINRLFGSSKRPFKFEQIPFSPVKPAPTNGSLKIVCGEKTLPAFQYYSVSSLVTTREEYLLESAQLMATYLHRLLGDPSSQLTLIKENHPRSVQSSDIAILVRSHHEADIVKKALDRYEIQSVFLSNRKSVFGSHEAKELFWILDAVLNPHVISKLLTALATRFFTVDMQALDGIHHCPSLLEAQIETFAGYQHYWSRFGVMAMIRHIMATQCFSESCLATPGGERTITNILHLTELLQACQDELDHPHAILNWLAKQIAEGALNEDTAMLRLESDENLIKIVTIHKSKGLEYPIVFVPFLCSYQKAAEGYYFDRTTNQRKQASKTDIESLRLLDEERLAEDIRLCYVALTRAIYMCCIGIGDLKKEKMPWFRSGFGSLVLGNETEETLSLDEALSTLQGLEEIRIEPSKKIPAIPTNKTNHSTLSIKQFQRKLCQDWTISSYSSWYACNVSATSETLTEAMLPEFDTDAALPKAAIEKMSPLSYKSNEDAFGPYSVHHLPKGAAVGTLLHELLQSLDFTAPFAQTIFDKFKHRLHLSEEWTPILYGWLNDILTAPLSENGLSLQFLSVQQKLAEMDFFLPIRSTFSARQYHGIMQQCDPLTATCKSLTFDRIAGMLKGFIDLVFEWQGKFYIVDYKSNALGPNYDAYDQRSLEEAMRSHRYDVQYQLYTLALHRYLRQRIPSYHYERHFGGVFYLFLRGITSTLPGNGIFYCKPQVEGIDRLDSLFEGQH